MYHESPDPAAADMMLEPVFEKNRTNPATDAEAQYALGCLYTKARRTDEAIVAYRRAIALRPDFPEALCNLGMALEEQGQLAEAIVCFREALGLKPNMPEAAIELGLMRPLLERSNESLYQDQGSLWVSRNELRKSGVDYCNAMNLPEVYKTNVLVVPPRVLSFVSIHGTTTCPVCGGQKQLLPVCDDISTGILRRSRLLRANLDAGREPWLFESTLLQCSDCGHGHLHPLPTRQLMFDHYSHSSTLLGNRELQDYLAQINSEIEHDEANALLDFAAAAIGDNVDYFRRGICVDVGCNAAWFMKAAIARGLSCLGIEADTTLCERNRQYVGCEMFCGFIEDVPADHHDTASLVVMLDTLEHHISPAATLTKARDLLKEDGLVLISVPNYAYWRAQHNVEHWEHFHADHLHYFSPASMERLLEAHGFDAVAVVSPLNDDTPQLLPLFGKPNDAGTIQRLVKNRQCKYLWAVGRKRAKKNDLTRDM